MELKDTKKITPLLIINIIVGIAWIAFQLYLAFITPLHPMLQGATALDICTSCCIPQQSRG